MLRFEAGKRLLGVILLSDGAQRATAPHDAPPQTAAAQMKQLGFPLFTIPFGQSRGLGEARDVAVKDLGVDEQVFVQNLLDITGEIRVDGYVNHEIPVRVLFETAPGKMEVVDQQTIRATSDGQLMPVKFTYAPQTPGEYKLTLDVPGQPSELVTTNNQLSTFVNVLKGGLKVLYLEGCRAGSRGSSCTMPWTLRATSRSSIFAWTRTTPETVPRFPCRTFKPGKYDVYILGDLDANAFQGSELDDLAKTVSQGAGLIMLGGFHSFGPGGYANTPLGQRASGGDGFAGAAEPGRSAAGRSARARPLEDDAHGGYRRAALLAMLAATQQENMALWDKLPPLEGANRFTHLTSAPCP